MNFCYIRVYLRSAKCLRFFYFKHWLIFRKILGKVERIFEKTAWQTSFPPLFPFTDALALAPLIKIWAIQKPNFTKADMVAKDSLPEEMVGKISELDVSQYSGKRSPHI